MHNRLKRKVFQHIIYKKVTLTFLHNTIEPLGNKEAVSNKRKQYEEDFAIKTVFLSKFGDVCLTCISLALVFMLSRYLMKKYLKDSRINKAPP